MKNHTYTPFPLFFSILAALAFSQTGCEELLEDVDISSSESDRSSGQQVATCFIGVEGNIVDECEGQRRRCIDDGSGAECGGCKAGYELDNEKCVASADCVELGCEESNKECPAQLGDECGACVAGSLSIDGACRLPNCAQEGEESELQKCEAQNRLCLAEDGSASCQGCKDGFLEEDGDCRPVVQCASDANNNVGLSCAGANQQCTPATQTTDATCGDCAPGFLQTQEGLCRAVLRCNDLNCAEENRTCVTETANEDASCGSCSDTYQDEGGACTRCEDSKVREITSAAECTAELGVPLYADSDGDGFGATESGVSCQCSSAAPLPLYSFIDTDCNDSNSLNQEGDFEYSGEDQSPEKAELCDGYDNDCDGVIDEGCPRASSIGIRSLIEGSGGTALTIGQSPDANNYDAEVSTCASGQVVNGFRRYYNNYLNSTCYKTGIYSLQPQCVEVIITQQTAVSEYNYSATTSSSVDIDKVGQGGGAYTNCGNDIFSTTYDSREVDCATGQVMTGVVAKVSSGARIAEITAICSTFDITSGTLGTGVALDILDSSNREQLDCPVGSVVTGFRGATDNGVRGLQLYCSPLTLETISE